MKNRLKMLYDEYMEEKHSNACNTPEHQMYMKNLAMEMAAIEFLMTTSIDKHVDMNIKSEVTTVQRLSDAELTKWVNSMWHTVNGEKQMGAKWTIEQTSAVATQYSVKFEHITHMEWWVAMNAMWHDHYNTAVITNMTQEVKFFVCLAKDFLFDEDGKAPAERLYCYYHYMR